MSRRPSTTTVFLGAAMAGLAGGLWLSRRHDRSHQYDLFAPEAYRRFAALGSIARDADPANVPLLQDYLAWESVPALRSRAREIAAALEAVT